jgi:hypothetical protein
VRGRQVHVLAFDVPNRPEPTLQVLAVATDDCHDVVLDYGELPERR